jgi:hypothetical protein
MRRLTLLAAIALVAALPLAVAASDPVEDPHETWRPEPVACSQCHACEKPTEEDPCLVACPRHGGHFFGEHRVDEGPNIVIIDQLADLYEPVVFAHQLHASMANMSGGCENCHHYSETTGEIPPCRSCHDPDRTEVDLRMPALKGAYHRQCINCHLDWAHENACGFCHEEVAEGGLAQADSTDILGIPHPRIEATDTYNYETSYENGPVVSFHHADHTEAFGLQCVDCHRGDSCASCHDTGTAEARQLDHIVTCGACHAERDCGFCHSTEPKPRFDHATSVGWKLEPYHGDVSCTTCHGDPKAFHTPTGRCADCHIHWEAGSFDHRQVGLELSETHEEFDCEDCHADRAFEKKPHCTECHEEELYPEYLPGEKVARR